MARLTFVQYVRRTDIYIFRLHQFGKLEGIQMGLRSFRRTPDSTTVVVSPSFIPGTWGNRTERLFPVHSKVRRRLNRGIASGMPISFYYCDVIVQNVRTTVSVAAPLEFGQGRVAATHVGNAGRCRPSITSPILH